MFTDMTIPHQVWVLVGLAFLVADLAAPGLILSFLGLGCLLAAGATYAAPLLSLPLQGGVLLAGTLFGLLVIRPPLRRAQARRKARRDERDTARQDEPAPSFAAPAPPRRAAPARDRDPFGPDPARRSRDLFADLTPPKPRSRPSPTFNSQALSILEEDDDERAGFDLLEPVLDDGLHLSIDEEPREPLLLTDAVEQPERPAPRPKAPDLDLSLSLDGDAPQARSPLGRTVRVLSPIGPFTAGEVELDGVAHKAFSDHTLKPGDAAAVVEQMPDHPEILVVAPRNAAPGF